MEQLREFTEKFFLTAGECNPEQELPLPLLMTRIIEIATMHANAWGVGYAKLIEDNQGWVLSRVTIEMTRYPHVNEEYSLTTWIEDYNRHFSQRNMEINDKNNEVIGHVRTIWMVINMTTRDSVDISSLSYIRENISSRKCPIEAQNRLRPVTEGKSISYTFQYTDCDVNRHVNTVKYLDLLMNQLTLDRYDQNIVHRLEIAFIKETHYGDTAQVHVDESNPLDVKMSIDVDGMSHCRARMVLTPRE